MNFDWLKFKKKQPEPPKPEQVTIPVYRPARVEFPQPPKEDISDATLVTSSLASMNNQMNQINQKNQTQQPNQPNQEFQTNQLGQINQINQSSKTSDDARLYLEKVRAKENDLAMSFAAGNINRKQFEEIYAGYQREIRMIEQFLTDNPESQEWKNQMSEGQSILIRKRHRPDMVGFSIYDLRSGLPIKTRGDFGVDPALFVPMLFAYQSATREIFGGEVRLTQIEGGKWLCFLPGSLTSTIALFTNEPTSQQLKSLEQAHKVFEEANQNQLNREIINPDALVLPHDYYLKNSS
jgi:hypothetical protein